MSQYRSNGVLLCVSDGGTENEPTKEDVAQSDVDITFKEVLEVRKRRGERGERERKRKREREREREEERGRGGREKETGREENGFLATGIHYRHVLRNVLY